MRRRGLFGVAVATLLSLAVVSGCGSDPEPSAAPGTPSATATPSPTAEVEPATIVATSAVDVIEVFDDLPADAGETPETSEEPDLRLDRRDEVSGQLVFVVAEQGAQWHRVDLPVRPNGSTGWVRAADVTLASHHFRIQVSLGDHELVVTKSGEPVLTAPVGVGVTDTPTPGGTYYLKELLQPPDPDGVYGPYAYGLSGFSTALTSFAGGEGVIGIHGTNKPELVGTDVSNGCIRLDNAVVTRMVEEIGLPLGTPVDILA